MDPIKDFMEAGEITISPELRYRNAYGTDASLGYNVGSGALEGAVEFPPGDHRNGNVIGLNASWGDQSGPAFGLKFTKRQSTPEELDAQAKRNPDKYSVGLDLFKARPAGSALGLSPGQMEGLVAMPDPRLLAP